MSSASTATTTPPPNSFAAPPPDTTQEVIDQAKATVNAVIELEGSPGWQWQVARVTKDLLALSTAILTDPNLRGDALADARAAFMHHHEQFVVMYRDFQIALKTLHQHQLLATHLIPRLATPAPAAPHPANLETYNPFAGPSAAH